MIKITLGMIKDLENRFTAIEKKQENLRAKLEEIKTAFEKTEAGK